MNNIDNLEKMLEESEKFYLEERKNKPEVDKSILGEIHYLTPEKKPY